MTTTIARAGDRDRQKTATNLGQALAQGYLALDEYDRRLQTAFQTQTAGELKQLVADLPLDRIRRADPRRRAAAARKARTSVRIHLAAFLALNAIVLTTWAATGVAYFWPIWPILGTAIGLVSHALAVRPLTKTTRYQGV
jgi:fatty acid desaturase